MNYPAPIFAHSDPSAAETQLPEVTRRVETYCDVPCPAWCITAHCDKPDLHIESDYGWEHRCGKCGATWETGDVT